MDISISSNISSAEELTEEIITEDNEKGLMRGSGNDFNDIQMGEDRMPGYQDHIYGHSDTSSHTIYTPIKAEHVRIFNLHVDPGLKPNYVRSVTDNSWLSPDRETEESKRKGIIRYLSSEKGVPSSVESEGIVRALSYDNVRGLHNHLNWTRRGSLDDGLRLRLAGDRERERAEGKSESENLSSGDALEECDAALGEGGPITAVVDELEFRAGLKNERCHFMLADLITESIEVLHAEEQSRQRRHHRTAGDATTTPSRQKSDHGGRTSSDSEAWAVAFSNAETTALAFIDEILAVIDELSAYDGRPRLLPVQLQTLLSRLEKRTMLSQSFELMSSLAKPPVQGSGRKKSQGARVSDSDYHCTEAMIKAAIGSVTVNFPVGGSPILGPDMSLPSYVVSRTPAQSKRSATLSLQQNTCPGCQSAFLPEVARRMRLCHYYCLYFCSVCHSNTLMLIPAHILTRWDFTMLPVSRPARDLLQLIHTVPIFAITNFPEHIRSSLRVLTSVCRLRRQGRLLLNFIEICRQGSHLTVLQSQLPPHWFCEGPMLFSIADFRLMESGQMEPRLREVVTHYIEHISLCPVCQARGFLCELEQCNHKSQVIFPFEIDLVVQCTQCCACFHARCYRKESKCPRCERRRRREQCASVSSCLDEHCA